MGRTKAPTLPTDFLVVDGFVDRFPTIKKQYQNPHSPDLEVMRRMGVRAVRFLTDTSRVPPTRREPYSLGSYDLKGGDV
jgi:hypothetical protein